MSAPTQPTTTTIVTEAYRQFGISNPSAGQLATAIAEGIEKVKRDIWELGKKWKLLQTTQYIPISQGVSRYANPSDFESDVQEPAFSILDGVNSGVLQTADTSNAVLASDATTDRGAVEGHLLLITSGTGVNQAEQVKDYTFPPNAVMRTTWGVTPAGGDGYLVVDKHYPVAKLTRTRRNELTQPWYPGTPREVYQTGKGPGGYVELFPVPDRAYGLKRDYFSNLLLVDITSTLYNYILRDWAGVFTQGTLAWLSEGYDDTRAQRIKADYAAMLRMLGARELDGHDESNLVQKVGD